MAKKPSGLKTKRENNQLTFSWKREQSYTAQQLQWRLNYNGAWKSWNSKSVSAGATSATLSLTTSKYYPTQEILSNVEFKVRGKKGSWSSWASNPFVINKPLVPTVTSALSNDYTNVTTFTWTTETSDTDSRMFYDIEWQAVLQEGYNDESIKSIDNWSALTDYKTGTSTLASDSATITEVGTNIASGSHTRWFRCRSRGAGGPSDWAYEKHVYSSPYQANIKSISTRDLSSGSILVDVVWETDNGNSAFPIDDVTVQYSATVPDSDLAFPVAGTWTDANIAADAGSVGAAKFETSTGLTDDQVLFIRVNTKHDRNITYGVPTIAKLGTLETPESLSVSTDDATHKATVSVTNKSTVPDSYMAIKYCPESNPNGLIVGIIPHGQSSAVVQCPNWSDESAISFEVYAVQGAYTTTARSGGVTEYRINPNMISASLTQGGSIPVAPASVTAVPTNISGTVQVTWAWSWTGANGAEISWANHADAWESTEAPSIHEVTNMRSSKLNVSGLETGLTWYFRVRLYSEVGDTKTYGAYSETKSVDLSSAPLTPLLRLSSGVITTDGMTTATWGYISGDGTAQRYAEICEATYVSNVLTYGDPIASTNTAQHIDLYAKDKGWTAGTVHYLCLRVQSESGVFSDTWSPPVPVIVAEPLTCAITATSLDVSTVTIDGVVVTVNTLDTLPLTVTVSGAGSTSHVTVAVERASDYFLDRPDESEFIGYNGETIALMERQGNGTVTIEKEDLIGILDDGADYRIIATINDELGQAASDSLEFTVGWDHKALIPTATFTLSDTVMEITPVAPVGADVNDTCDIYRLSKDKPQLILEGVDFGTKYVDAYPTIGDMGGYRIVYKSQYGDYITSSGELAWVDYGKSENVYYFTPYCIIDFGSNQVMLEYDMDINYTWEKDFKETKYLGGSVKGDWNPGVKKSSTINSFAVVANGEDTIQGMRMLAEYSGICKVRTPDGSNYFANVDVSSSYTVSTGHKIEAYTLTVKKVDGDGLDGQTYLEWSE